MCLALNCTIWSCVAISIKNKQNQIVSLYFRSILESKTAKHFYLKNRSGLFPCYPKPNTKKLILTEAIIDAATLLQVLSFGKDLGWAILSCYGKLFTCILNNRLHTYLENSGLLCEEQAGFRKGYSTTDHISNLKCLIDLYLHRGRKLYCVFVDYRKAFDSVRRVYLWQNC